MNRKVKSLIAAAILLFPLCLTGCGNATTLNRVGAVFVQGAAAYKAELSSLRVAGLLSDAKFARLDRQADALNVTAAQFRDYLNSLPGVTKDNKAQILSKIAEMVGLVSGIVTNPDLIGAKADSTAVKVLQIAVITLQNAAIAVAALDPPPASSRTGASPGIATDTVKVKLPKVPQEAEKYFK